MTVTSRCLIPVPKWNDHHPWPPPGGMRHLIFNAETNGFASAFKRVGRRVLVDEVEFFRCVEQQNAPAEAKNSGLNRVYFRMRSFSSWGSSASLTHRRSATSQG